MANKENVLNDINELIQEGNKVLETKYFFDINDNNRGIVVMSMLASGYKVEHKIYSSWTSKIFIMLNNVPGLKSNLKEFLKIKEQKKHTFDISNDIMNFLESIKYSIDKNHIIFSETKNKISEENDNSSYIPLFKVKGYKSVLNSRVFPIFSLTTDSWNDYGTVSSFYLTYHHSMNESTEIGMIKILEQGKNEGVTELPNEFSYLSEKYISLGQGPDFYEKLLEIAGRDGAKSILESLNDISWDYSKAKKFESQSFFRNSLLRENSANEALKVGHSIIWGEKSDDNKSFKYSVEIKDAESNFDISFDFDKDDEIPGRIFGIIGKNAVGKTQIMGMLANDLVQLNRKSQESINDKNNKFSEGVPFFNKVIAISYSAFDSFKRPENPPRSYYYSGVRNEKGALSKKSLIEGYRENLIIIKQNQREHIWIDSILSILGNSEKLRKSLQREISDISSIDNDSISLFSSGQRILIQFITSVVARLDNNSIILFDEPETHLHPNAIASLFNILNKLLSMYDSYSIIATHSPIIIQEIPSKRVCLLTREGNNTTPHILQQETFGESISDITSLIFDTYSIPNYYKEILENLSNSYSYDTINKIFNNKLSFNAKSFLLSQYGGNLNEKHD